MSIGSRMASFAFAGFCLWSMPSLGAGPGPVTPPDPSSVTVPDLGFTPTPFDMRRYDDYFYFYKPNVTYEAAFADLDECRLYGLSAQLSPLPPKFVPLGAGAEHAGERRNPYTLFPQYGIAGSMIAGLLIAGAEDDAALATQRRCMAYKGYGRFGLTRALWKAIGAGSDAEKLARLARIASGPQPQTGALDP